MSTRSLVINTLLRSIPSMEDMLNAEWAVCYFPSLGRERVKKIIDQAAEDVRREILSGKLPLKPPEEAVESRAKVLLSIKAVSTLKTVVNATGVILHTNLGRAPLAAEAVQASGVAAGAYCTLEYSPERGGRENRNAHVEELICFITGAQAALVVNNNAAAVLLVISAIAAGREVIVSNGELVEIGDSFRIPEILSFSGAKMVAVGCTNATYKEDYQRAITEHTAILLKVHPSNYQIDGFIRSASREELAKLAASRDLVFMEDLGSGRLCSLELPFAKWEHSVQYCLKAGAAIVTFSGDKLLGGPQIGVIAGSKKLIDTMRSHQLLRALRVDKMTLAAFEATLRMYSTGRENEIPVIRMIKMEQKNLLKKASFLCRILQQTVKKAGVDDFSFSVAETNDVIGGGAFPTDLLPGYGVTIHSDSRTAESIAAILRTACVPIIAAIHNEQVILHVRTLLDNDESLIKAAFTGNFYMRSPYFEDQQF